MLIAYYVATLLCNQLQILLLEQYGTTTKGEANQLLSPYNKANIPKYAYTRIYVYIKKKNAKHDLAHAYEMMKRKLIVDQQSISDDICNIISCTRSRSVSITITSKVYIIYAA